MRCPDCNKFVSMDSGEPQDIDLSVAAFGDDGDSFNVRLEVRIVRTCAECSTELKEATVEVEELVQLMAEDAYCQADGEAHRHAFEIDEGNAWVEESGGGRYAKNMISCEVQYTVTCANGGCGFQHDGLMSAGTNAGSFEEME